MCNIIYYNNRNYLRIYGIVFVLHISNMKKNNGKYREVNKLPSNAITVAQYANNNNFTTNYVYNQIKTGKHIGKFEVVVFQTFNFIIPV